jgi:hypothetical protein
MRWTWTGTGTSSDRTNKDCRFLIDQISSTSRALSHPAPSSLRPLGNASHAPSLISRHDPPGRDGYARTTARTTARTSSTDGVRTVPEVPTRRSAGQGKVRTGDRRPSENPDGLSHARCRKVGGLADAPAAARSVNAPFPLLTLPH